MGTAQNQGVNLARCITKAAHFLQVLDAQSLNFLSVSLRLLSLLFNGQSQAFAGLNDKLAAKGCCVCLHSGQEFFKAQTLQSCMRPYDAHAASFGGAHGRFQSRFDAHKWQFWKPLTQTFNGHCGGRVARHHHCFDIAFGNQLLSDEVGPVNDKFITSFAIGRKGTVRPINESLMRHFCAHGLQHTQPANAAVKDANGLLSMGVNCWQL